MNKNKPEDPDGRVGFDAGDQRERPALWHATLFQFVREKGHDVRSDTAVHHQATLAAHRALKNTECLLSHTHTHKFSPKATAALCQMTNF